MVLGVVTLPLYMRYFPNNAVLGVWFTILNVLSWILNFDLGIGNGLRNHLTVALSEGDDVKAKRLVSSAYGMLGVLVIAIGVVFYIISSYVDWNNFFNISSECISTQTLRSCVNISMFGILLSFWLRIIISILYAMQKAAIPNLLSLCTSVMLVVYLLIMSPTGQVDIDFTKISIYHAIASNIPLLVATLWVFRSSSIRICKPSIKAFDWKYAKDVLSLGVAFLTIQLLYMVISTTNEWFISKFYAPEFCVEYQAYNKVFTMLGSLFMIALAPLWSAITKACAENNYEWISKLQKLLYGAVMFFTVLQIVIVPFLPKLFDWWLGDSSINVNYNTAWLFVVYGVIFTWIAIQSTFASGLGRLKVQLISYIVAVAVKVVGVIVLSSMYTNWSFVIAVTIIGLLPYSIAQPIYTKYLLKKAKFSNS